LIFVPCLHDSSVAGYAVVCSLENHGSELLLAARNNWELWSDNAAPLTASLSVLCENEHQFFFVTHSATILGGRMPAKRKTHKPHRLIRLEDEPLTNVGPTGPGGPRGPNQDPGSPGQPEFPSDDDFERLAKMLERIRVTLKGVIFVQAEIAPTELQREFGKNWREADEHLDDAISRLRHPRRSSTPNQSDRGLRSRLVNAGMTGEMLRMKEVSLTYHLDAIDGIIFEDSAAKASLGERAIKKLLTWFKPAGKVMNSILGSLVKAFPGMEIVKELKEHIEASYETAGAMREEREG
jgi:hypothetical protein